MLVLSRSVQEKVVFPDLATTIQVVSVKGSVVRLSFDAPDHLRIYREELLARLGAEGQLRPAPESPAEAKLRELGHALNNRLNASTIGLALLRRQLEMGRLEDMKETLDRIENDLQALRERAEKATADLTPPPSGPRKPKALLVEDDRNECELLAGFLRLGGVDVGIAGDGADALDYLRRQEKPDVVLLDMLMPRCDGPTTVREIRGDPHLQGLKIFGVTGVSDTFGLSEGPGGIDRWFRKPLNPEALLRELKRDLGK
jgi:carbon storage regulator CsrA